MAIFLLNPETMNQNGALLNVSAKLLAQGFSVRFSAPGTSMGPTIRDGETITVAPAEPGEITVGDIVAYRRGCHVIAHRVVRFGRRDRADGEILLRGDAACTVDAPVAPGQILGKVVSVERRGRQLSVSSRPAKLAFTARVSASRARRLGRAVASRAAMIGMLVVAYCFDVARSGDIVRQGPDPAGAPSG